MNLLVAPIRPDGTCRGRPLNRHFAGAIRARLEAVGCRSDLDYRRPGHPRSGRADLVVGYHPMPNRARFQLDHLEVPYPFSSFHIRIMVSRNLSLIVT